MIEQPELPAGLPELGGTTTLLVKSFDGVTRYVKPHDPLSAIGLRTGPVPVWKISLPQNHEALAGPPKRLRVFPNNDALLINLSVHLNSRRPPIHQNADYDELIYFFPRPGRVRRRRRSRNVDVGAEGLGAPRTIGRRDGRLPGLDAGITVHPALDAPGAGRRLADGARSVRTPSRRRARSRSAAEWITVGHRQVPVPRRSAGGSVTIAFQDRRSNGVWVSPPNGSRLRRAGDNPASRQPAATVRFRVVTTRLRGGSG